MFQDTPLIMVEDDESLKRVVEHLRPLPVIGVDTEADSFHHYKEKLCLIQVSDSETDYIVDPLKINDLSPIGELLQNRDQVKVLHGGDYDVVSLKRDYGFYIHNIFDTMIAGQFLGIDGIGLADLIGRFFGYKIDKKYQRHDWARRPLEREHLEYARGDTHFLLALREVLQLRLDRANRRAAHEEECAILEEREWSGRGGDGTDFLRVKKSNVLDPEGLKVLRSVWRYRDGQAESMDRPAFKVLPGTVLLQLSKRKPTTEDELHQIMRANASMTRQHGAALLQAVIDGLADEQPLPKPEKKKRTRPKRPRPEAPSIDLLFGQLKQWRNETVDREGLAPVVVASNSLLKDIATHAPLTLEALNAVPGVRRWQVQAYGEEILAHLQAAEAKQGAPKKPKRRRRKRSSSGDGDGD